MAPQARRLQRSALRRAGAAAVRGDAASDAREVDGAPRQTTAGGASGVEGVGAVWRSWRAPLVGRRRGGAEHKQTSEQTHKQTNGQTGGRVEEGHQSTHGGRAVWPASARVTSGLNMYEQVRAIRPFVSDRHDYDGNAQPPTPTLRTPRAVGRCTHSLALEQTRVRGARARARERLARGCNAGIALGGGCALNVKTNQRIADAFGLRVHVRRPSAAQRRPASPSAAQCRPSAGPAPPSARRRAVGGLCRCCNGEVATARLQRGWRHVAAGAVRAERRGPRRGRAADRAAAAAAGRAARPPQVGAHARTRGVGRPSSAGGFKRYNVRFAAAIVGRRGVRPCVAGTWQWARRGGAARVRVCAIVRACDCALVRRHPLHATVVPHATASAVRQHARTHARTRWLLHSHL
jgi:hypothetical protein